MSEPTISQAPHAPQIDDPMVQKTVALADNFEPVLQHPDEAAAANAKLAARLAKAGGKRPNILVFMMGDVGWGDLGCGQLEDTLIFITSDNGPEMELWPDSGYTRSAAPRARLGRAASGCPGSFTGRA
jgi:hypothetical protein